MDRWLAIISDLHISEGQLDDFDDELEAQLTAFLEWLGSRPEPAELVINGDFLDFVQASPWSGRSLEGQTAEGYPLCFTEQQSCEKLVNIKAAHPQTFAALGNFLSREQNRLVILPGNHDPDFFWPLIRERTAEFLGVAAGSQQLHFCLDRSYRPERSRWLLIEHGHQYDDVNSFFVNGREHWSTVNPPILTAKGGENRLYECTGTRFLIRYLNSIDARYPYVDNVKPFSRFLRIFGASALTPGWGPLDAAVSVTMMLGYLTRSAATRPQDIMGVDTGIAVDGSHPLVWWVRNATEADRACQSSEVEWF